MAAQTDSASKPQKTNLAESLLLDARGIHKSYRDGERTLNVLTGADFHVKRGESVAIVGRSGAGKSTLLHLLGALDQPSEGEIMLDGEDFSKLGSAALAHIRSQKVGFIYQFHHLLPEFSALENVLLPGMINRQPTAYLTQRARQLLENVGLAERTEHRPTKLSGGEQQRVALARALMNNPLLVLADEPTGDLDQKTGREVMDFVLGQTVGEGRSLVIVTHDPAVAARTNRTYQLENGKLIEAER